MTLVEALEALAALRDEMQPGEDDELIESLNVAIGVLNDVIHADFDKYR